jgi:caffeoyl-CoA O-methyltransferase
MLGQAPGPGHQRRKIVRSIWVLAGALSISCILGLAHTDDSLNAQGNETAADAKVRDFLARMRSQWNAWNVSDEDGKVMYDTILEKKYTRALELGTSTGRSGTWIAWALSKTGGKLITIELDPGRHEEAVRNFREAGVISHVDARLADAHKLVYELAGPFDFIFIDADKGWYRKYAEALIPKLTVGGCLAAHNVRERRGFWRRSETGDFYEYVQSLPNMKTSIVAQSWAGMSMSYKIR